MDHRNEVDDVGNFSTDNKVLHSKPDSMAVKGLLTPGSLNYDRQWVPCSMTVLGFNIIAHHWQHRLRQCPYRANLRVCVAIRMLLLANCRDFSGYQTRM